MNDRRSDRHDLGLSAGIYDVEWRPNSGRLDNLSRHGFLVSSAGRLMIGARLFLGIGGAGIHAAEVVRRAGWRRYGCQFETPLTNEQLGAALAYERVIWAAIGSPTDAAAPQ